MCPQISALQQERAAYHPKLPSSLRSGKIRAALGEPTEPATDREAIRELFPHTYGQPLVTFREGKGQMDAGPMRVGVVLSGGQAPGGHNVIAGLYDALIAGNANSKLFGFLKGPGGVIQGKYIELTADIIEPYRNTGGFDMIRSGRDKIETPDEKARCKEALERLGLDGLVIIGGDDSNTNAAVLAEYLKAEGAKTSVVGVPKTIDGDMKNEIIETSFGFDTAARVYSELIGNVARDARSAVKYWHFIRLMGRAASHVALECALQTHPNVTLISEEVAAKHLTLQQIVNSVVDVIVRRAAEGRNYGIVVVPEGLIEFVDEIRNLINELSVILGRDEEYIESLPHRSERLQYLETRLSDHSGRGYGSLPGAIQEVLLKRDKHGNVLLSQVETERLLVELVEERIGLLKMRGRTKAAFVPLTHFFGYEGRCAAPSNFDADYCYSLGFAAAQLVRTGLTGYTASVTNLTRPHEEWVAGGVPVTMMLNMEDRKGKPTPVIRKALVELEGNPFKTFSSQRDEWAINDSYVYPGPIQYFGPREVCDAPTLTLALERTGLEKSEPEDTTLESR